MKGKPEARSSPPGTLSLLGSGFPCEILSPPVVIAGHCSPLVKRDYSPSLFRASNRMRWATTRMAGLEADFGKINGFKSELPCG